MTVRASGISRAAALLLGAALLVGPASCSEPAEQSLLEIVVYTPFDGDANPFEGVGWIRMGSRGTGLDGLPINERDHSTYVRVDGGFGELGSIPYGDIQMIVEGYPANDDTGDPITTKVLSSGASTLMRFSPESAPRTANIYLLPHDHYAHTARAPALSGPAQAVTRSTSARVGGTATALPGGSVVLMGGGFFHDEALLWDTGDALGARAFSSSIEIYSSTDGTFTATGDGTEVENGRIGHLLQPRAYHTSVALPDGRIAVLGGVTSVSTIVQPILTTEIFDPRTGIVTRGPELDRPRAFHSATLIPGTTDQILLVGGTGEAASSWVRWSVTEGAFTGSTGVLEHGRERHTATLVPATSADHNDAIIVVAGGQSTAERMAASVEFYTVASGTWDAEPVPLANPRTMHTAVYNPKYDFVFLIGGFEDARRERLRGHIDVVQVRSREIHDQTAGFDLAIPRAGHTSTMLSQNRIVIAGGMTLTSDGFVPVATGEVVFEDLHPETNEPRIRLGTTADMPDTRFGHAAVALETGHLFVAGGATSGTGGARWDPTLNGVLYNP